MRQAQPHKSRGEALETMVDGGVVRRIATLALRRPDGDRPERELPGTVAPPGIAAMGYAPFRDQSIRSYADRVSLKRTDQIIPGTSGCETV